MMVLGEVPFDSYLPPGSMTYLWNHSARLPCSEFHPVPRGMRLWGGRVLPGWSSLKASLCFIGSCGISLWCSMQRGASVKTRYKDRKGLKLHSGNQILLELQRALEASYWVYGSGGYVQWGPLSYPSSHREPAPRLASLTLLYLEFFVTDGHWPESLTPPLSNRKKKSDILSKNHCPLPMQGVVHGKMTMVFL